MMRQLSDRSDKSDESDMSDMDDARSWRGCWKAARPLSTDFSDRKNL